MQVIIKKRVLMGVTKSDLKIKDIDLSSIEDIKVVVSPGKRGYGRRFRLECAGKTSNDLIFKDIFKQVIRISRVDKGLSSEERLAKLKLVKTFLGDLKLVNASANEIYANQDSWYQFRTWFHRLFDFGTHLERIEKLEARIQHQIEVAETPLNLQSTKPIETFLSDNLTLFQATTKNKRTFKVEGYEIHLPDPDTILISNDREELKISLQNGAISQIERIRPDMEELESIPEQFSPILKSVFEIAIARASRYGSYSARIVQSSISEFPVWHLNQISKKMISEELRYYRWNYEFVFLTDSLSKQPGLDAGGLSRGYLNSLMGSLQNQASLFHEAKDGLKVPRIERQGADAAVLDCSYKEAKVYHNMGMLMRCCHNDYASMTGVYFNDILFNLALDFSYSELHTSFSALSSDVHVRLVEKLIQGLQFDPESTELRNIQTCLKLLDKTYVDSLQDTSELMIPVLGFEMEDYLDNSMMNVDLDKIKENREKFIEELHHHIFTQKGFISQLNGASIGEILSPIYHMARGMAVNDEKSWAIIRSKNYRSLSTRVQGELNRKVILDSIVSRTHIREATWLKEWIEHEATNEDLTNFLKFVTGSTGLPFGSVIKIKKSYGESPYPISHTCFFQLELSDNNPNKESFIEKLKEAILVTDFGMY